MKKSFVILLVVIVSIASFATNQRKQVSQESPLVLAPPELQVTEQAFKIELDVPDINVVVPVVKVDIPDIKVTIPDINIEIPTFKSELVTSQVDVVGNIWIKYVVIFISGSLFATLISICYKEFSRSRRAKEVVEKHLDPILKAADQLLGQIVSLSRKDFKSIYIDNQNTKIERMFVLYLFAQFWARVEILRKESLHVNLNKQKDGKLLLQFIRTLRARRNRIIDRANQQAIGESIMFLCNDTYKIKTFFQFLNEYFPQDSQTHNVFETLDRNLLGTRDKKTRQLILLYGAILHAMTDSLDPKHEFIRERSPYPNKLTEKTRRDLEKRVFEIYLPMVKKNKYWKRI